MRFGLAWTNDFFFLPDLEQRGTGFGAGSDSGDTNRIGLNIEHGPFRLDLMHQMLTEYRPGARWAETLRTDFAEANGVYSWSHPFGPVTLQARALAGVALVGALGGAALQNAVHQSGVVTGRTLGNGLQATYVGGLRAGPTIGGGVGVAYTPTAALTLSADVDARSTFGTGLAKLTARPAITLRLPSAVSPFLSAGVAFIAQQVWDDRLSLSGGYVSGAHAAPSVTAGIDIGPARLTATLQWNELGSGQNVGQIGFSLAL